LVEVPYWWDGTVDSLAATIHAIQPKLISKPLGQPIPKQNPVEGRADTVPLNHGLPWDEAQDLTGW